MRQNSQLAQKIAEDLILGMERSKTPVPVGVSNRHFHITEEHWRRIFGEREPKMFRRVRQPGFWAAEDVVDIEGPKGRLSRVRLVAPYRKHTQVEVSRSDAVTLGLEPPVRGSGSLKGAAPIRLIGPKGSVDVPEALVIAQRHLHFTPAEARQLKVGDGDSMRVRAGAGGPRELVFENVLARVSDKFALEFHVDTDEANAAWLKTGDFVHLV
ncbi:MAG: phosphate propanoyltransferase [Elusimicrobiota bacterium]